MGKRLMLCSLIVVMALIASPVMAQVDCDDGDPCTNDLADDTVGQCTYTPVNCDDSDLCTFDVCDFKTGCGHYLVVCSDGDPLTTDTCDPATGCVYAATDCDDVDVCTVDQIDPHTGQCTYSPVDCDDDDSCTDDTCDRAVGCQHAPVDCDDSNPCTDDLCDLLAGCEHAPVDCEDDDPTTIDACDPADGACLHTPMASVDPMVSVDIKPGSCHNPLNVRSRGVLPVVILGSEALDVMIIDPARIRITRDGFEGISPLRYRYEDVGSPSENGEPCVCDSLGADDTEESYYNGDGYMDLVLKFRVPDLAHGLGLKDVTTGEIVLLTIVGETMADATPVAGEDCVSIINKLQWWEQPTRPKGPKRPKEGH
jgi:hypothetical protein